MNPSLKALYYLILLSAFFPVQASADMLDAHKALSKKKYARALTELKESAVIGNAEAQYKLGVMYFQGQSGKIDKINALAWMSLAAERGYPKAIDLAKQIYKSIPNNKRSVARKNVEERIATFGKLHLDSTYYPVVHDEPLGSSGILVPAKLLKRDEIHYNNGGNALAHNSAVIQSLKRNAGTNDGAYSSQNLSKQLINADSGKVITQYDIDSNGNVKDVEVIFEYPLGRFAENVVSNIYTYKYAPAKNVNGNAAPSHSVISRHGFGISSGQNLNTDYPNTYQRFRKFRTQKESDPVAKYQYAMMLRAYGSILPEVDRASFVIPLLESAKSGFYLAQLSYAEYEIYQRNNLNAGLPWLFSSASAGLKEAEYRLGDLLMSPNNAYLEKDVKKAKFWLDRAAKKLHPLAVEKLAALLLDKPDKASVSKLVKLMQKLPKKEVKRANLYYYQA